jgi:hypothetical protein
MMTPYTPKPHIYEKDHIKSFTVDELTQAYALFMPPVEARAAAEMSYGDNPEGSCSALIGDTFAALATVSDDAARRVADLLEEPLDFVLELRDDLLSRLSLANQQHQGEGT